ncbi:MAG TPA: response regulator, partial [Defluviitaleaceae bacterium]|nr:response regulator [Defluviitaleaceae bacterium]
MKDTIMIVDDSKELRKIIKLYLENAGYEIIEAENGKVAIELLKNREISLMILDIMMPQMDGFELLEA